VSRVLCPHCGGVLRGLKPAYDKARDQLMLDLGRCVDCGRDKTDAEITKGHWRCATCRARRTRHAALLRHGHDGLDSARIYRPRAGWK